MGKVRQLYTKHEQVTDENGVLKQQSTTTVTREEREPPYVKLYIEAAGSLEGLGTGQRSVLYELVRRITYDGMILITAMERKRIIAALSISEKTFRNHLTAIVKSGLIIRHSPSDYEANPHYFARGSWKEILERRKTLEMTIRYLPDGTRQVSSRGVDNEDDK